MKRMGWIAFVLTVAASGVASADLGIALGIRPIAHYALDIDDFDFDYFDSRDLDDETFLGLEGYFQWWFTGWLGVELHAGYLWGENAEMDIEGVDVLLAPGDWFVKPYLKAGLITSDFDVDDAVGSFERTLGFEGGVGVALFGDSPFSFEVEALYRDLDFKYDHSWRDYFRGVGKGSANLAGVSLSVGFSVSF